LQLHSKATRITGRLVTSITALQNLTNIPVVETIISLDACGIDTFSDCALVYIGRNLDSRKSPNDILIKQEEVAKVIFNTAHSPARPLDEGFSVRNLGVEERTQPRILEMYYKLYASFGWSTDEIQKMLSNRNSLIFAAFNQEDHVVSSALAESGTMSFIRHNTRSPLSLVEITEAATLPEYRGNGLYQAVSDEILKYLARLTTPPNLVFGELNLDAPGVLKVAARQGRIPLSQLPNSLAFPCLVS